MNKKALYSILSTIVAMIVLSVSLVLVIGPKISAANISDDDIVTLDSWDDFLIVNNILYGLSDSAYDFIYDNGGGGGSGALYWRDYHGRHNGKGIDIKIPEGVVEIVNGAFFSDNGRWYDEEDELICGDILSLQLPRSLKKIGYDILYDNGKMTSIVIPSGVEEIAENAFNGTDIETIYCETATKPDGWEDGWNHISIWGSTENGYDLIKDGYANVILDCNKTVTFNTNGSGDVDSQVILYGNQVTKPTDPTKEGYTFKGWYNGEEAYDFTTPVKDSMTLTAQWEAIPEQPEPSNPEQPTTPENPEQPTTPDTDTETVTVGSKNGFNLGAAIGGGLVAGLGTISAIAATVIARRRHK